MGIFISKLNKHNPLHSLRFSGTTKKGSWTGYEPVSQHLGLFKTTFWTLFFTIGNLNLHTVVVVWPFQTEADGFKDGFTFLNLTFLVTNMFLCNQALHQVRILVHYPTPKNTFSVQVHHQSSPPVTSDQFKTFWVDSGLVCVSNTQRYHHQLELCQKCVFLYWLQFLITIIAFKLPIFSHH